MFVCNYCRDHALDRRGIGAIQSKGTCELCGFVDACYDLHLHTFKPNWQELVYKEPPKDE